MPVALPVLGAAAKFLMANGARAATMKFGKAAVDKAKDQIKKRDSAISDKAGTANIGVKRTQKPESTRKMQDTKRDKKMAKEEIAGRSGKSDLLRPPKDEAPLRFKKGGMKMKAKGMAKGGMKMKAKGMAKGGKLPMVEKDGKKVPFYAADGKGKMKAGGMMKSKGMAKGGMKMKSKGMAKGGMKMKSKGYAVGGMKSKMATKKKASKPKVRGAGIARKGVRPTKMR